MNALDRYHSLCVADVMSRGVVAVSVIDTMAEAAIRLAEHEVSGAPVVDDQGRCVGVLTANDFVRCAKEQSSVDVLAGGAGHRLEKTGPGQPLQVMLHDRDTVRERMSTAVQTVDPSTPLAMAAEMMCRSHIHHLVVLDERGAPAGMVTTLDLLSALLKVVDESQR